MCNKDNQSNNKLLELPYSVKLLYKSIENRYVKIVWTEKIQEKQAAIYCETKNRIFWTNVILMTLISIFSFAELSPCLAELLGITDLRVKNFVTLLVCIFSAVCSALTFILQKANFQENALKCHKFALGVRDIRNDYEALMTDIKAGTIKNCDEIMKRRDELSKKELVALSDVPYTSKKAYVKAEKALKKNKEVLTEDDEILAMVPKDLVEL